MVLSNLKKLRLVNENTLINLQKVLCKHMYNKEQHSVSVDMRRACHSFIHCKMMFSRVY